MFFFNWNISKRCDNTPFKHIVDRPGVVGAVLQTPSSFVNCQFQDFQILTSPTRNLERLYICLVVRLSSSSFGCTQRYSRSPITCPSSRTFPGPDQTRPDQTRHFPPKKLVCQKKRLSLKKNLPNFLFTQKCSKISKNVKKCPKIFQNPPKCFNMIPNALKRSQTLPNAPKLSQIGPKRSKKF